MLWTIFQTTCRVLGSWFSEGRGQPLFWIPLPVAVMLCPSYVCSSHVPDVDLLTDASLKTGAGWSPFFRCQAVCCYFVVVFVLLFFFFFSSSSSSSASSSSSPSFSASSFSRSYFSFKHQNKAKNSKNWSSRKDNTGIA